MLPGLCGDAAPSLLRVFLGTHPTLAVDQRLLRQLQAVYPWYASRKRVKEAANEFVELDLASIDAELMLRYSHVFFVRRQVCEDMLEKQIALLDAGKPPKAADIAVTQCLGDINRSVAKQVHHEMARLADAKQRCNVPNRRELDPNAALQPFDILAMMRVVEEDAAVTADGNMDLVEGRSRAFLPAERVHEAAAALARELLEPGDRKEQLEKKDVKLWGRQCAPDYNKVGCIAKYRPLEVAAYYRFYGERIVATNDGFKRALWGNLFRKFASNPTYLAASVSRYWALHSGLDTTAGSITMPMDLAQAACRWDGLFPALTFRNLYMYSSVDVARHLWRVDPFVPLMRLFPLLGLQASNEAVAFLLVEEFWASLVGGQQDANASGGGLLEDSTTRAAKQFVEECCKLREANLDALLNKTQSAAARVIPEQKASVVERPASADEPKA